MKLDDFYYLGFSDYCHHLCCYFHNVSADMSSGLLQVFVEPGNLHATSNYVLFIEITGSPVLIQLAITLY